MSTPPRAPFRSRSLIGLLLGVAFLIGAIAALAGYVHRFGFDGSAGFGVAVIAADTWFLIRAVFGPSARPGTVRTLARTFVFAVGFLGPVLLVILAFAPIFARASSVNADRALLVVVGLLLVLVLASAALGGRGPAKDSTKQQP